MYQASNFENCYVPYRLGQVWEFYNIRHNGVPYFSPMWFGSKVGVSGISPLNDALHICYHSQADLADGHGVRIPNDDFSAYEITVSGLKSTDLNYKDPEIS